MTHGGQEDQDHLSPQQQRAMRDAQVVTQHLAGVPVAQIAATHGLTGSRVRQILAAHDGLDDELRRRQREHRRRLEKQALRWSQQHPAGTIDQAATALGVDTTHARQLLGDRAARHQAPVGGWHRPRYTPAQVDAALTAFVADGGRRQADYEALHASRGWPSLSVVITHHQRWSTALAHALGQPATPGGRRPRFTDADLDTWVARYLAHTPTPWTLQGLTGWLRTQAGAPSGRLVRSRLGTWPAIRQRGLDTLTKTR